jgi:hypothetical protein
VFNLGNKSPQKAGTLALSLAVVLSMLLWTGGAGTAAVSAQAAAEPTTVAQSPAGSVVSNIVSGTTASGLDVTGYFTPLKFRRVGDQMRVRGLVSGTIQRADGAVKTFDVIRTMRVRSITQTGDPATAAKAGPAVQAAAVCDILHLVLGPLDLNLLGLRIQLNRVVLDITAITGALLGDLLCAISGLLNGGLLGQLRDLLNQILGRLGLGL